MMTAFTVALLVLTKAESLILSFSPFVLFFLILLILGIRKTKKLKEENRALMDSINFEPIEQSEH